MPAAFARKMPYQKRVKTCDGSHIDSNVGSFSTEAVINTFNFVCLNGDGKGSLVAKFPVALRVVTSSESILVQSENECGTQKATHG